MSSFFLQIQPLESQLMKSACTRARVYQTQYLLCVQCTWRNSKANTIYSAYHFGGRRGYGALKWPVRIHWTKRSMLRIQCILIKCCMNGWIASEFAYSEWPKKTKQMIKENHKTIRKPFKGKRNSNILNLNMWLLCVREFVYVSGESVCVLGGAHAPRSGSTRSLTHLRMLHLLNRFGCSKFSMLSAFIINLNLNFNFQCKRARTMLCVYWHLLAVCLLLPRVLIKTLNCINQITLSIDIKYEQ